MSKSLTPEQLAEMLKGPIVSDWGYRTLLDGDPVEFTLSELVDIVALAMEKSK